MTATESHELVLILHSTCLRDEHGQSDGNVAPTVAWNSTATHDRNDDVGRNTQGELLWLQMLHVTPMVCDFTILPEIPMEIPAQDARSFDGNKDSFRQRRATVANQQAKQLKISLNPCGMDNVLQLTGLPLGGNGESETGPKYLASLTSCRLDWNDDSVSGPVVLPVEAVPSTFDFSFARSFDYIPPMQGSRQQRRQSRGVVQPLTAEVHFTFDTTEVERLFLELYPSTTTPDAVATDIPGKMVEPLDEAVMNLQCPQQIENTRFQTNSSKTPYHKNPFVPPTNGSVPDCQQRPATTDFWNNCPYNNFNKRPRPDFDGTAKTYPAASTLETSQPEQPPGSSQTPPPRQWSKQEILLLRELQEMARHEVRLINALLGAATGLGTVLLVLFLWILRRVFRATKLPSSPSQATTYNNNKNREPTPAPYKNEGTGDRIHDRAFTGSMNAAHGRRDDSNTIMPTQLRTRFDANRRGLSDLAVEGKAWVIQPVKPADDVCTSKHSSSANRTAKQPKQLAEPARKSSSTNNKIAKSTNCTPQSEEAQKSTGTVPSKQGENQEPLSPCSKLAREWEKDKDLRQKKKHVAKRPHLTRKAPLLSPKPTTTVREISTRVSDRKAMRCVTLNGTDPHEVVPVKREQTNTNETHRKPKAMANKMLFISPFISSAVTKADDTSLDETTREEVPSPASTTASEDSFLQEYW